MGRIDFEGWNTQIDDLKELNGAPEVRRLGLEFKQFPGLITASRAGNVAAYYLILQEVRNRLVSGGFAVTVVLSTGERRSIEMTRDYVFEDGKNISDLF
ncbi:hypothetical protein MQC88_02330 [Luteimonas sp. 50]|uniref:Uncharacterized protein n=1 Tax=Cognatiluteimonas sedimenti TaxID=2927791 RepID=A0ABT0A1E1_9GAMM|nr:hypothetical protein [Lysobacter sedimenti]MCJ0824804.1 hypothetical protein [Lysobacter sedimenti]